MIDTHTHLYDTAFGNPGQTADSYGGQIAAIDRAVEAGVDMMVLPAIDAASFAPMKALAAARPDKIRLAAGLHPTELGDDWHASLAAVETELLTDSAAYVAVGEIGMDLYWDKSTLDAQMQVFDRQLSLAARLKLPVLIHCREALDETLEVLSGHTSVPAVFHSFGGSVADVERIRRLGDYYFGINGIVTFKNSGLREVLPHIGIDRLLTETDSPYLAPVPHRGKRNESAMIPLVVGTMAQAMGMSFAEVASATSANAAAFFRF